MPSSFPLRIILTGFMGTGKTTIGVQLADRLGYLFCDTDRLVEEESGKTIAWLFKNEGEPAFRQREKEALRRALRHEKVVISAGGGAVIDAGNRRLMKKAGLVISLTAPPEVILARVGQGSERPLLQGGEMGEAIKNLLRQRAPFYGKADLVIDTSQNSVAETVQELLCQLAGR